MGDVLVTLYGPGSIVFSADGHVYRAENGILKVPPVLVVPAMRAGFAKIKPQWLLQQEAEQERTAAAAGVAPPPKIDQAPAAIHSPVPADHPQAEVFRDLESKAQKRAQKEKARNEG